MKKYYSVFALAARGSFTKVVAVTLLVAVLCGSLLLMVNPYVELSEYYEASENMNLVSADDMIARSFCILPAYFGFAAVVVLLSRLGTGKGTQPAYFVKRLNVKTRVITVLWTIYNFIMIFFYRVVIALAVYGIVGYRLKGAGPQALLLASYGNKFMHNLIPLRDIGGNILLISITVLAAIGCALVPVLHWRNHSNSAYPVFYVVFLTGTCLNIAMSSDGTIIMIVISIIAIICLAYQAFKGDEEVD